MQLARWPAHLPACLARLRSNCSSSFNWYSRIASGSCARTLCSSCICSCAAAYIDRRQTNQLDPARRPPTADPQVAAVIMFRDVANRKVPIPMPPAKPTAKDFLRHGALWKLRSDCHNVLAELLSPSSEVIMTPGSTLLEGGGILFYCAANFREKGPSLCLKKGAGCIPLGYVVPTVPT